MCLASVYIEYQTHTFTESINKMKRTLKIILSLTVALTTFGSLAGEANAQVITLQESQAFTGSGQNFNFSFGESDGLVRPGSEQAGRVLIELFDIDLSFSQPFENFTYDVESISQGGPVAGVDLDTISSTTTIGNIDGTFSFEISPLDLSQALDDLVFNLDLDFTNNVGDQNTAASRVAVTLTYQSVPEPSSSLLMFGVGVVALTLRRRCPAST